MSTQNLDLTTPAREQSPSNIRLDVNQALEMFGNVIEGNETADKLKFELTKMDQADREFVLNYAADPNNYNGMPAEQIKTIVDQIKVGPAAEPENLAAADKTTVKNESYTGHLRDLATMRAMKNHEKTQTEQNPMTGPPEKPETGDSVGLDLTAKLSTVNNSVEPQVAAISGDPVSKIEPEAFKPGEQTIFATFDGKDGSAKSTDPKVVPPVVMSEAPTPVKAEVAAAPLLDMNGKQLNPTITEVGEMEKLGMINSRAVETQTAAPVDLAPAGESAPVEIPVVQGGGEPLAAAPAVETPAPPEPPAPAQPVQPVVPTEVTPLQKLPQESGRRVGFLQRFFGRKNNNDVTANTLQALHNDAVARSNEPENQLEKAA